MILWNLERELHIIFSVARTYEDSTAKEGEDEKKKIRRKNKKKKVKKQVCS